MNSSKVFSQYFNFSSDMKRFFSGAMFVSMSSFTINLENMPTSSFEVANVFLWSCIIFSSFVRILCDMVFDISQSLWENFLSRVVGSISRCSEMISSSIVWFCEGFNGILLEDGGCLLVVCEEFREARLVNCDAKS